jgi:hypothetical protein
MKNIKHLVLVCCALICSQIQAQMFDDSEEDFTIKKGRFYYSLTFSLDQRKAENEDQLLRQVINQNKYDYRIIANAGYAIKDNMTLGVAGGYGRLKEEITFLDENDEEVTSKRLEQGFSIVPNMRNYIPLGKGRLQVIIQTELGITVGESLERVFYPNEIDRIEGDFLEFTLGVNPGLLLFFNKNWAFEVTVGAAGLTTRIDESVLNNDEGNKERVESTSIDLRLNILQLNLGVAFYL